MTLIEVIDAARALLSEPLDSARTFPDNTSSFWKDAELQTYFNMAQHDVALEMGQTYEDYFVTHTDISIVQGTAEYSLPARFMKVRRVEDRRNTSDPVEIYPVTINERPVRNLLRVDASGSLWAGGYYLKGNSIVFTDTPTFSDTSAIRMYYTYALADLTAASLTSEIPVEHHKLLVWGTVRYALFQQQSDTTKADLEYEKLLLKLKTQAEDRQIQRPRRVKTSISTRGYGRGRE